MFKIFSGNPEDWFSAPESGPWWDARQYDFVGIVVPIVTVTSAGAVIGFCYGLFTHQSLLGGAVMGVVGIFGFVYLPLYLVIVWRDARLAIRLWTARRASRTEGEKLRLLDPPF